MNPTSSARVKTAWQLAWTSSRSNSWNKQTMLAQPTKSSHAREFTVPSSSSKPGRAHIANSPNSSIGAPLWRKAAGMPPKKSHFPLRGERTNPG